MLGLVGEAVLARYLGAPDELAFNSAAIAASLESLTATPLADSPIAGHVPVAALEGFPLGTRATPGVLLPIGWFVGARARNIELWRAGRTRRGRFASRRFHGDPSCLLARRIGCGRGSGRPHLLAEPKRPRPRLVRTLRGALWRSVRRGGALRAARWRPAPARGLGSEEKLGFLAALAGAWVSETSRSTGRVAPQEPQA